MIVVVAEKPSVGRDIARVLKCREAGQGFVQGEGYIVTWAVGHLVTLCEPDELDARYKKWRMEDLPILPETIPTKVIPKTKPQFSVIKKLICQKDCERVICATDAGREGELIFRLIYEQAKCQKPVDRLWISSMTDEAIREGFAALKPASAYDGLYQSAACRSQADWLVGMNASRAFTLRYDALLSVGRVQTPTLALLVKRHHEIADFKPVEYHTLTADFGDYAGQWFDANNKDERENVRIPDKATADALAKRVKGKQATVAEVTREEKRELPPQLYDLTSLQRDANRQLGFTAQKTLKIAQDLYEKWKAVTYPRTDSRYLPNDMIGRAKTALDCLDAAYQPLVSGIPYREGKLPYSKRVFDNARVSDHHAIIPTTRKTDVQKLPPDDRALFDLIAKRLIAAFYPAHEYDAIRVTTVCEEQTFKSSGRVVRVLGWKAVYQSAEKAPDGEQTLPALQKGDARAVQKATVKKEATKPPPPHTDASILSAMEYAGRDLADEALREQMKGSGLGTPATRAAIIERLITVGYASRKGRAIFATDKGVRLIAVAPEEIASPEMTGKWELALNEIAAGKRDTARFMEGIRRMSAFLVEYARGQQGDGVFEKEQRGGRGKGKSASTVTPVAGVVCPLCGKPVQENAKAFGCSDWKNGCRFTLWKDCAKRGGGPLLSEKLVTLLLKDGAVAGSTGTLAIRDGMFTFTKKDEGAPTVSVPIRYEKK